jgi:hypothetical protein
MYVLAKNVNYGYSVATHGKYLAAGNPPHVRYDPLTSSLYQTGTVEVFRHDVNTDTHHFVGVLQKPLDFVTLLATETGSLAWALSASLISSSLHTELYGYDFINRDKDLSLSGDIYIHHIENDYGHALDAYNKKIAIGCRYYWERVIVPSGSMESILDTSHSVFDASGSCVDIWDYTYSERNQYTYNDRIAVVGYGYTGSGAPAIKVGDSASLDFGTIDLTTTNLYYEKVQVPAGYDYLLVTVSSSFYTMSMVVAKIPVSPDGQYATYAFTSSLSSSTVSISYNGLITNEIRRYHIENPNAEVSNSFGQAVAINRDWLAIGSPHVSSSKGKVYLYKNDCTGSILSWSLYQTLEPAGLVTGQLFGWDLSLDKKPDTLCPNRLVVGCGASNNNNVYLYELSASEWVWTYTFHQNTSSFASLTFNTSSYGVLMSASYQTSSFGWAVATYGDTVVIGAPTERNVFEYTGSAGYEQGTVYIFERCSYSTCPVTESTYRLAKKVYGDLYSLKNNRLGWSVSVYDGNMVLGVPKRDVMSMSSCYVRGSVNQQLYCGVDLEDQVNGQWMYFTYNTGSGDWEFQKTFQKKKKFMKPYRSFGADVSVGDLSIAIGAPMNLSNLAREIDIVYTSSFGVPLDDFMGKTYIYNIPNYKPQHYVGNIFYRNGTLVVNSSGSVFEGLFFDPTNPYQYEYLLRYKSQHTVNEKQILCTVEPGEFNVSTNPSAVIKATSSFDLNRNGSFDFQDADILLRYMQYKTSTTLGGYSFDWSSSIVKEADEVSFYNWNAAQWNNTGNLFSESLKRFENVDTQFEDLLDFNQDNKIDINDMLILWKYFSHRLTEQAYLSYINSNCQRQQVSQVIEYLDDVSKRAALPMIDPRFYDYDNQCCLDKTGSYLSPFVTTIGIYAGLDLVAVAKLGSPIKLPKSLPINFVVKMDF